MGRLTPMQQQRFLRAGKGPEDPEAVGALHCRPPPSIPTPPDTQTARQCPAPAHLVDILSDPVHLLRARHDDAGGSGQHHRPGTAQSSTENAGGAAAAATTATARDPNTLQRGGERRDVFIPPARAGLIPRQPPPPPAPDSACSVLLCPGGRLEERKLERAGEAPERGQESQKGQGKGAEVTPVEWAGRTGEVFARSYKHRR